MITKHKNPDGTIAGVQIDSGARIGTVYDRYVGNISGENIRIGCEVHTPAYWDEHQVKIATKHSEEEWWDKTGQYMLAYLKTQIPCKKVKEEEKGK